MRAHTRDLPPRVLRFPHLPRRERPTSARLADQTVERGWRQAMPRAEPALSLAPLLLSAVVGAAFTTGMTTPVTPSGPPPRTADTGRVSCPQGAVPGQPPSGYPGESPGADLALRHAHCHDTSHPHGPKGRSGGVAGDCPTDRNLGAFSPSNYISAL